MNPLQTNAFTYVGTELYLFALAANWKTYWRNHVLPYITGDVLEVGAGIGANTKGFQGRPYRRWVCLEPDAELNSELHQNVKHLENVDVVVGTLERLPAKQTFDTILYIDVLEHIDDDGGELATASSHLRPGGHLIVLGPAHERLYSPFDKSIGHFRRYSRTSLRRVAPHGMELISLRYLDSAGLIASAANRLFLRQAAPTEPQILFWDRHLIPVSLRLDPLLGYRIGKSILGIWRRST